MLLLNASLQIIGTEWLWIVFLVVFLLFGSQKLPELSRAIGKAMGEFQRGRAEVEREIRLATAASYNNPPRIEQRDTTPVAPSTLPPPSPAPAMNAPAATTMTTAAPAPVVTASTTTTATIITTPEATSEKTEPTSEHPSKRPRTTKTRKSPAKTSRPRKKKDNSAAK